MKKLKYGVSSLLTRVLFYGATPGWLVKAVVGHPIGTRLDNDPPKFSRVAVDGSTAAIILGVQPHYSINKDEAAQVQMAFGDVGRVARTMENFEREGGGLWGYQVRVDKAGWQRVSPGVEVSDAVTLVDFKGITPESWDSIIQEAAEWDKTLTSGKNVMVHCKAGVGRSHVMTIAYMMFHQNKSFLEALTINQQARPQVDGGPRVGSFFKKGDKLYKKMPPMVGLKIYHALKQRMGDESTKPAITAKIAMKTLSARVNNIMQNKGLNKLERALALTELYRYADRLSAYSNPSPDALTPLISVDGKHDFTMMLPQAFINNAKQHAALLDAAVSARLEADPKLNRIEVLDKAIDLLLHREMQTQEDGKPKPLAVEEVTAIADQAVEAVKMDHQQAASYGAEKQRQHAASIESAQGIVTDEYVGMRLTGKVQAIKWYKSPLLWVQARFEKQMLRRQFVDAEMLMFRDYQQGKSTNVEHFNDNFKAQYPDSYQAESASKRNTRRFSMAMLLAAPVTLTAGTVVPALLIGLSPLGIGLMAAAVVASIALVLAARAAMVHLLAARGPEAKIKARDVARTVGSSWAMGVAAVLGAAMAVVAAPLAAVAKGAKALYRWGAVKWMALGAVVGAGAFAAINFLPAIPLISAAAPVLQAALIAVLAVVCVAVARIAIGRVRGTYPPVVSNAPPVSSRGLPGPDAELRLKMEEPIGNVQPQPEDSPKPQS